MRKWLRRILDWTLPPLWMLAMLFTQVLITSSDLERGKAVLYAQFSGMIFLGVLVLLSKVRHTLLDIKSDKEYYESEKRHNTGP